MNDHRELGVQRTINRRAVPGAARFNLKPSVGIPEIRNSAVDARMVELT